MELAFSQRLGRAEHYECAFVDDHFFLSCLRATFDCMSDTKPAISRQIHQQGRQDDVFANILISVYVIQFFHYL